MVQKAVEDGRGDGGVVVEDARPVLVGGVGGDDHDAALVAGADDLEEQVRPALIHGEVAQLVDDQEPGAWAGDTASGP